ncbi:hybrid sensor histidine kinase/response regulator [Pseudoalteromonas rubra]|uniref:hybrid sensor histidine kinase/response regulator n=1 Tax=Pseudoalteromonas rubra TaxID=43658 RepID=UPI000F784C60|nr:response regulator [Pseudoalteromonas rubra]
MKYLIEGAILGLIWWIGAQAITQYYQLQDTQVTMALKARLNRATTELSLETLSAMDSNIYHFDRHAQKQLEFESVYNELLARDLLSDEMSLAVAHFHDAVDTYMQLASMLKTSYRYIAKQELEKDAYSAQAQLAVSKSAALVSNLQVTNSHTVFEMVRQQLMRSMTSLEQFEQESRSFRVMRLHIDFILENALPASNLLVPIQNSTLSTAILRETQQLSEQVDVDYWQMTRSILLLLLLVFLLIIVVLLRLMSDLKRANAQANLAAETKSLFLSNMSHEIRTPMNGIMGLTDILLATELTSVQRNYLEKVRFSANALTTIINDILDFSKIESKKLNIEQTPFQFEELLDNLRSLITPIANTKGVKLIFDIDPLLSDWYIGDPVRINQIMLNFTSNAAKFTETGSITLAVHREAKTASSDWVEISVTDTGIGIEQDKVEQLFERFTQAEASTTRRYGGTGLGLTICKLLTELMEGNIAVVSEVGQGSTFSVRLPLNTVSKASLSEQEISTASITGTILIVEDDPIYMEVSDNIASSVGLTVSHAQNGRQAEAMLSANTFDMLLLDWVLPDCEANGLLERLETLAVLPAKVVIYTAHTEQSIAPKVNYPILYKPLLKKDLISLFVKDTPGQIAAKHNPEQSDQIEEPVSAAGAFRVLLVEDNEINRIVATKLLDRFELDIVIAENGQQAVDVIKSCDGAFDLVLMDIQMPVMDGMEATRILRETYDKERLTIIALTANVMQSEVDKYLNIGMNAHLGKPFKTDELDKVLEKYIFKRECLASKAE